VSLFWEGSVWDGAPPGSSGTNCPDVWRPQGSRNLTVGLWLLHPPWQLPWVTAYTVGEHGGAAPAVAAATSSFGRGSGARPREPPAAVAWRQRGVVDQSSEFIAAQSFTDAAGRRVLFGWVQTPLPPGCAAGGAGPAFVGLQSFPRELWIDPADPSRCGARLRCLARSSQ
jgi:sucrose-6-phosphate hydrolase SacC (GH32 family)